MALNLLGSSSIFQAMADALPTPQDSTSALSSSAEAIALFVHACIVSLDFRLIGLDEDKVDEAEVRKTTPRLPSQWNSRVSSYALVYAHHQSGMRFLIKVDRLGGKAEIRSIAIPDDKISRFELNVRDYISSAALPLRFTEEDRGNGVLAQKLQSIFMSSDKVDDLAKKVQRQIIQPLMPGLHEEESREPGDVEIESEANTGSQGLPPQNIAPPHRQPEAGMNRPVPPPRVDNPDHAEPRATRPIPGDLQPPDFEDEYQMIPRHDPRTAGIPAVIGGQPQHPLGIGHNDLYPPGMGPNDGIHGFLGPSMRPGRPGFIGGIGGPSGGLGGGMHPGLDDPLFAGLRPSGRGQGGRNPDQVPPGARWDPTGPGGHAPFFGPADDSML